MEDLLADIVASSPLERNASMEVKVEENLLVEADASLLFSAVSNLVQNAIKFTREDSGICLRARAIDGAVCIEVEDRCGGLKGNAATDDLFRPFVQGNGDRRGVGLGLAIARRAVEAHGGTLRVRDLPDVGCVFAILLPRTNRATDE